MTTPDAATLAESGRLGQRPTWSRKRRAVLDPGGRRFASISAAACAVGTTPSSIHGLIERGRQGWRYASDDETADADAPASAG